MSNAYIARQFKDILRRKHADEMGRGGALAGGRRRMRIHDNPWLAFLAEYREERREQGLPTNLKQASKVYRSIYGLPKRHGGVLVGAKLKAKPIRHIATPKKMLAKMTKSQAIAMLKKLL